MGAHREVNVRTPVCRGIVRQWRTWPWTAPERCLPVGAPIGVSGSGMRTVATVRTLLKATRAAKFSSAQDLPTQHGACNLDIVLSWTISPLTDPALATHV